MPCNWSRFASAGAAGPVPILVRDFAEEAPMAHKSGVRLRSAFYGTGFTAARSMWNGIVGEDSQQFIEKGATHAKSGFLQHGLSIAPCGDKRTGKADAIQRRAMPARRLEHESAH